MILADILRLLHPIMPFITDAIWPNIANKLELSSPHLLKEVYPHPGQYPFAETHSQVQKLQKIITAIRTIRSEMNVSPKQIIDTIFLISQHHSDQEWLNNYLPWLKGLGKCQQIEWLSSPKDNVASVSAVAETITVYVPLEGLIDKATEIAKIQKNILKLDTAIKQCQSKLNNANYCQNAPADVVQKEQDKCTQLQHEHQQYQQQLTTIQAIPD